MDRHEVLQGTSSSKRHMPAGEWSLLVLKPDSIGTNTPAIVRQVLSQRGLRIVTQWHLKVDVVHVLAMWPLDIRVFPITFLILCDGMVGKMAQILVCSGPDAVNNCIQTKQQVRSVTSDFLYACAIHCPDTIGEAVAQCSALSRPSALEISVPDLLPAAWHGWPKEAILEAMAPVSDDIASFGWNNSPTWSPYDAEREVKHRIKSPRKYEGQFDNLVLSLADILKITDLEMAIRTAFSALYDPAGLPVPADQVRTRADFKTAIESEGLFLETRSDPVS